MKKLIAVGLVLILSLQMMAPLALAAEDWDRPTTEEEDLRAELDQYGSVDQAMDAFARHYFQNYRGYFDPLMGDDLLAFRKLADRIRDDGQRRGIMDSLRDAGLELGYVYEVNQGSWAQAENRTALYLELLLLLARMEKMSLDDALALMQQGSAGPDGLLDLMDLMVNLLEKYTWSAMDEAVGGITKMAAPKGVLENSRLVQWMKIGHVAGKTADDIGDIHESAAWLLEDTQLIGLYDAFLTIESGRELLRMLENAALTDAELARAMEILEKAYDDYQESLRQLSQDADARDLLANPDHLAALLQGHLETRSREYLRDDSLQLASTLFVTADVLAAGGMGNLCSALVSYVFDQYTGYRNAYQHYYAMEGIDALYDGLALSMKNTGGWQDYYDYAGQVQWLTCLALMGENHLYRMIVENQGLYQDLFAYIGALSQSYYSGAEKAEDYYAAALSYLDSVEVKAREYRKLLLDHYEKLCALEEDVTALLGREGQGMAQLSGVLTQDQWFARLDDPSQPDYQKKNQDFDLPAVNVPVRLLANGQVIGEAVSDARGYYQIRYPRLLAQGKQLTLQIGQEAGGKYAIKTIQGPSSISVSFPASFRWDEENQSVRGAAEGMVQVPYADDFFLKEGYQYELALCSLALSAAAMNDPGADQKWTAAGDQGRDGNIRSALGKMGYTIIASENYDQNLNLASSKVPYILASRDFEDPDAREAQLKKYHVIQLTIGADVNSPALSHVWQRDTGAMAAPIAEAVAGQLKAAKGQDTQVCLWITGFGWGGSVANQVRKMLDQKQKETGSSYHTFLYTFGADEGWGPEGNNLVYAQDLIGMGLGNATVYSDLFDAMDRNSDAQARVASEFYRLSQGFSGYNPAFYWADTTLQQMIRQLPAANGQRDALLAAMTQWQLMRNEQGTDYRAISLAERQRMAQAALGSREGFSLYSDSVQASVEQALFFMEIPLLQAYPLDMRQAYQAMLEDMLLLTGMRTGDGTGLQLDGALTEKLIPLALEMTGHGADPTDQDSIYFPHHPEVYLAWMLGMHSWEMVDQPQSDCFDTRLLPLPVNLKGVVMDAQSRDPLGRATVEIQGANQYQRLIADEKGYFETYVRPEDVTVSGVYPEYEKKTLNVSGSRLKKAVVETELPLEPKPLDQLVMIVHPFLLRANNIYITLYLPQFYSSINPRFNNQMQSHIFPVIMDAKEEVEKLTTSHQHYRQDYSDSLALSVSHAYSNGHIFSMGLSYSFDDCYFGHGGSDYYTYTVDVATGRLLTFRDLLNPENPAAEQELQSLLLAHNVIPRREYFLYVDHRDTEEDIITKAYRAVLSDGVESYNNASWEISADGFSIIIGETEFGFDPVAVVPFEKLEGVFRPEYLPQGKAQSAVCRFSTSNKAGYTQDGQFALASIPATRNAIVIEGQATHLWVYRGDGTRWAIPRSSDLFYAYGLRDTTVLLPEVSNITYGMHWHDADGYHALVKK